MSRIRLAHTVTLGVAAALALVGCAANNSPTGSGSSVGSDIPVVTQLPVPSDAANPAGNGNAKCNGITLAFVGAETGGSAQLGIDSRDGAQAAINAHNAANKNCQVGYKKFDTEGDPSKATGVVNQVINESDIIGVIGLPFSGESKSTGGLFEQAKLVHITPSATNSDLTKNGWTTFFRGLSPDAVQGQAAATFITDKIKANTVCVIQDDSDYGIGLANVVSQTLGSKNICSDKVTTGQKDFSAVSTKVVNAKPDAVFYAGYYPEGSALDQTLVNKGYQGKFVGGDGMKDPQFLKLAGPAGSNAFFTCPCVPGDLVPSFADAYKQVSGGLAPSTYSLEGYDIATILLKGIDSGITSRPALLDYVKNYDGDGLSKHFKWNANGELTTTAVYGYKVDNGNIAYVGTIS